MVDFDYFAVYSGLDLVFVGSDFCFWPGQKTKRKLAGIKRPGFGLDRFFQGYRRYRIIGPALRDFFGKRDFGAGAFRHPIPFCLVDRSGGGEILESSAKRKVSHRHGHYLGRIVCFDL